MQCNAAYGERTAERENSRNGYRTRPWDTRVGTIELNVPKLRRGVYNPEVLLNPRRRAEQALVAVICQAYVEGVSTRRVDDLVKAMGIEGMSKSEVSRLATELDTVVTQFKERPLDRGPYRYLWIDALTQRVREGGRVVNVSAVIATAVNNEGTREIIGFEIATTEDTAAWTAFLRSLVARGLSGVELVISDAHGGIKAAIAQVLAGASWQRCRTHFMANLATRCTKASWPMIATLVRSIFDQPDRDSTWAKLAEVTSRLTEAGFCDQANYLLDAADDILAFCAFPFEHWKKIRSNNPLSVSTRRSAGAPTWSGSSPTVRRSSASSVPCSPSTTTSGPSRGATCGLNHSASQRSTNHRSRIRGRRSSPHARRLPSISPRHRVHDEEVGTANVEAHKLLHHSLGLNP